MRYVDFIKSFSQKMKLEHNEYKCFNDTFLCNEGNDQMLVNRSQGLDSTKHLDPIILFSYFKVIDL